MHNFSCTTETDEMVKKHMESLKFILDKDLILEYDLTVDINYKLATLETKKSQVRNIKNVVCL